MKTNKAAVELDVTLVRDGAAPLKEQLYEELRRLIVSRKLKPGDALPSSRILAEMLDLGRVTVTTVYRRLVDEGYLESRVGRGTAVAENLPLREVGQGEAQDLSAPGRSPALSARARLAMLGASHHVQKEVPFAIVSPDIESLPGSHWMRIVGRLSRSPWKHNGYVEPQGYAEFRQSVADYLRRCRGINCSPEQVIAVDNIQQGLALCAEVLFNPGDAVMTEEPGYPLHRDLLRYHGLRTLPAPVSGDGVDVRGLEGEAARGILVTPSHQYPLGSVMPLEKRAALLRWALRNDAWVIEDDYDSELFYEGSIPPAIAGLRQAADHVVYLGSFTKTIYPGIMVAYMVVPRSAVRAFTGAKLFANRQCSGVHERIFSEYLAEGSFDSHIRRLLRLCKARRDRLVRSLEEHLGDFGWVAGEPAGTSLAFVFNEPLADAELCSVLRRKHGIEARPLGECYAGASGRSGLILGFAGFTAEQIAQGVPVLAEAVRAFARERSRASA